MTTEHPAPGPENRPLVGPIPTGIDVGYVVIDGGQRLVTMSFHTGLGTSTYFLTDEGAKQTIDALITATTGLVVARNGGPRG